MGEGTVDNLLEKEFLPSSYTRVFSLLWASARYFLPVKHGLTQQKMADIDSICRRFSFLNA